KDSSAESWGTTGDNDLLCMDVPGAAAPPTVRMTVKTPRQKEEFAVPINRRIREFKGEVSVRFSSPTSQLVLVLSGRILKDHKTLGEYGIHDEATIYLVVHSRRGSQDHPGQQTSSSQRAFKIPAKRTDISGQKTRSGSAFSAQDLQGLISSIGLSTVHLTEFRSQLLSTTDMMFQLLESPLIESMLSSPDLIKELLFTDSPLKQITIQKIPEMSHLLSTPDSLMLELARSPVTVREIMRNPKDTESCLASLLGGDNPLQLGKAENRGLRQRAALQQPGGQLFAPFRSCPFRGSNQRSPSPSQSATSICTSSNSADLDHSVTSKTTHLLGQSSLLPSLGSGVGAETPNTGGIQSMLHQVTESLQLIVNLCAFCTKWIMLLLLQRFQLAAPAAPSAEATQQQEDVVQRMPDFFQQIQNPEMLAAMSNPKAMQACLQTEQGLQILVVEAPVLIPWFTFRLRSLGNTGNSANAASNSTGSEEEQQHLNTLQMLQQAPEIKSQEEPEQLKLMGFFNGEESVRAVTATRKADRQQQRGGSIQSIHRSNVS
uniref:Ubiquitin-like domain-containing protein n=1 Tax=Apteryx owenii TaxID=8824 RepID=A0A8B9QJ07_APTOW